MTAQITIPTDAILVSRNLNRNKSRVASRNKGRDCNVCGTNVKDWFEIKQANGEYITENNGVATRVCTECTGK